MAKKGKNRKHNKNINLYFTGGNIPSVGSNISWMQNLNSASLSKLNSVEGPKALPTSQIKEGVNDYMATLAQQKEAKRTSGAIGDSLENIALMLEGDPVNLYEKVGISNSYNVGGWMQFGKGITDSINKGFQNAKIAETKDLKSLIRRHGYLDLSDYSNYDDLLSVHSAEGKLNPISWKDLKKGNIGTYFLKSSGAAASGFESGMQSGSLAGGIIGGAVGGAASLIGDIAGVNKAKKEARNTNREVGYTNITRSDTFRNQYNNIYGTNVFQRGLSFSANGGPINMRYTGTMSPFGNRFALGGNLEDTFTNGITYINNGGTHESSPIEGVPMGVDPEGVPNLVEEGEVIWDNNYVFSNRLKVPKAIRQKYKLRDNKDLTFADAALQMQEESEERPNDPISKKGLEDSMTKLMTIQEMIRQEEENNKFAKGGKLGNLFDGNGNKPNALKPYKYFEDLAKNTDFYDSAYLSFWDWMNKNRTSQEAVNWVNRINKGEFGDIGGNTFNFDDLLRLARDYKKGPVHNAFYQASRKYAESLPQEITKVAPLNLGIIPFKDSKVKTNFQTPEEVMESTPLQSSDLRVENPHWLRYASILGPGIGLLQNLLSKPDYSRADSLIDAVNRINPIEFERIGNYMAYKPLDRNYYINKALANNAASRRAIQNISGGNRATAQVGVSNIDYNTVLGLGELARQAEESNLEQRQLVEDFNRGTNQFNSQGVFEADRANQQQQLAGLELLTRLNNTKGAIDASRSASLSSNLEGLFNTLGNLGTDITNRKDRNMLIENEALYAPLISYLEDNFEKKNSSIRAKGGKLNKKYKKGNK